MVIIKTNAEEVSIHALSPLSTFGGAAGAPGTAGAVGADRPAAGAGGG